MADLLWLKVTARRAGAWLQRYLGLFEVAEEAELLWPQDQQSVTSALDASGSPAHPVDVLLQTINQSFQMSTTIIIKPIFRVFDIP